MEINMATEALDLPRSAVTIRMPHRLRVILRAMRIARMRRSVKLYRALADRDERVFQDVSANSHHRRHDWLDDLARTQMAGYLLNR
jgi:hypothetical protein